jgi:hypothetical protein
MDKEGDSSSLSFVGFCPNRTYKKTLSRLHLGHDLETAAVVTDAEFFNSYLLDPLFGCPPPELSTQMPRSLYLELKVSPL